MYARVFAEPSAVRWPYSDRQLEFVVYVDSAGRVAIAVNGGRAAVVLAVAPGDVLRVTRQRVR